MSVLDKHLAQRSYLQGRIDVLNELQRHVGNDFPTQAWKLKEQAIEEQMGILDEAIAEIRKGVVRT